MLCVEPLSLLLKGNCPVNELVTVFYRNIARTFSKPNLSGRLRLRRRDWPDSFL